MLLAFTGKLNAGKDTAGDRLAEMVTIPTVKLSFARKLKESAAALFDIDPIWWETLKNDPDSRITLESGFQHDSQYGYARETLSELTGREFLQRYGTESHRAIFGSDFWVDQGLREYDAHVGLQTLFYLTDCRFINEAEAIAQRGGHIYRVTGPDEAIGTDHVSEAGLPAHLIDGEIRNRVRGDLFANLDTELKLLARKLSIPYREEAWV